ncbi:Lrp/AsnC family transcriptional regulator [Streptomyces lydicus]|uniref:Lrp/AsnC family transcriptional regulator n=1 Tax=Streptomyces lydicus TaxID=47763 RepID=UPI0037B3371B
MQGGQLPGDVAHVGGGQGLPVPRADRAAQFFIAAATSSKALASGRLGWAELAQRTGTSPATVRRRLTDSEVLTFRCDVAAPLAGRVVSVSLVATAPARDVGAVHRTLAALPECRLVAAVTGSANLFATLWVSDIGDIQRRETALCARLPGLTVTDRIVGLRTVKRMGHLLDDDGRRTGVRPISPW